MVSSLDVLLRKSGKTFLSIFAVSAILPVMLFGVLGKGNFNFLTKADQPTELQIWFEPDEVVSRVGLPVRVKVMGLYDDKARLIPSVEAVVDGGGEVAIFPSKIEYGTAFTGQVVLGEISLVSKSMGKYEVTIPQEKVFTGLPNLTILSSPLTVVAK